MTRAVLTGVSFGHRQVRSGPAYPRTLMSWHRPGNSASELGDPRILRPQSTGWWHAR